MNDGRKRSQNRLARIADILQEACWGSYTALIRLSFNDARLTVSRLSTSDSRPKPERLPRGADVRKSRRNATSTAQSVLYLAFHEAHK